MFVLHIDVKKHTLCTAFHLPTFRALGSKGARSRAEESFEEKSCSPLSLNQTNMRARREGEGGSERESEREGERERDAFYLTVATICAREQPLSA